MGINNEQYVFSDAEDLLTREKREETIKKERKKEVHHHAATVAMH